MARSVPPWVFEALTKRYKFSAEEAKIIDDNWSRFAQIRFSSATNRELKETAQMVLDLALEYPEGE